jgi:N-acetylmuramoyl-L-alanine amidase
MRAKDLDTLARTLWGEARGEPLLGQIAVCWVIKNRAARGGWWGTTIHGVCKKKWQFSCWWDAQRPQLESVTMETDRRFRECFGVASRVLVGLDEDPTYGSCHYHTRDVSPPWSKDLIPAVTIGAHHFFNNVE